MFPAPTGGVVNRAERSLSRRARDRVLAAVFAVLALVAGGVVVAEIVHGHPPAVAVVSRDVASGPDGIVSVQFVGDTMLGGALQPLIDQHGYDWPFDGVRETTRAADFVLAVAEAPITDRTVPADPADPSFHTSPPAVAAALGRAGVDALSLATNHSFDTGPGGLADTMANVETAGLVTIGAGLDLARAEQPLLLRTALGTVGIVGMGESFGHRASESTPGTMVLSPEAVLRGRDLARAAGADWVVAVVHWGRSYGRMEPPQRYWAEVFAEAGYDLVVGSGPHVTQPIQIVGSTPVAYSVGDFVYGTNGRFQQLGLPGYGLAVGLEIGPDRTPSVTLRCLVTDNRHTGFHPVYCDAAQTAAFLPSLGPGIVADGDRAVLTCGCPARKDPE